MAGGHGFDRHRLALGHSPGWREPAPAPLWSTPQWALPPRFTVTAQEPCRRWAFRLENSSLRGRWVGEFAPQGGGTRLRFTEEVQPKRWWMGPFVKGYLKGQQARYAGDLRRALETRFG